MKDIMDFLSPAGGVGCHEGPGPVVPDKDSGGCLDKLPLAYSYTPVQEMDTLYGYAKALESGTVFPELDLPLGVYGNNFCKKGEM